MAIFTYQGAVQRVGGGRLCGYRVTLHDGAIHKVVVGDASEVEVTVCFVNLFAGDSDIVQSLSGGGVTEHLLEKEKLSGVVPTHDHLVVSKRLAEGMGRHSISKAKVSCNALQHGINRSPVDWLILIRAIIGLTAEHVVTEPNTRSVFKIEGDCLNYCSVDGDVAVSLMLTGVFGLLLQNRESISEGAVIIDEVGEPKCDQVAHAEAKVNSNDEEHIVSITLLSNKELGNADDVVHVLDWLSGVFWGKLLSYLFSGWGDEASLELTTALLDGSYIDDVGSHRVELNNLSHTGFSSHTGLSM